MSTIKSSNEHLTLNADGSSKDIKLQSNASEKVIVKSDGKVGIGTSSPDVKLHITDSQEQLTLSQGDSKGTTFDYRSSTGNLNIATNGINARTSPQFTLDLNGNVGIGTSSPTLPLDIVSNSGADALKIRARTGDDYGTMTFYNNAGTTKWADIQAKSTKDLIIYTNGGTENMRIDSTGAVTMPNQPAFMVHPASEQSDIATNATTVAVFGAEDFDVGSNFANNTFTAPVTGKYQLNYSINFGDFDTDFSFVWIFLATSNTTIYTSLGSGVQQRADGYATYSGSVLCDMDANDTAQIKMQFSGGASQANLIASSWFSGFLAC